MTALIASAVDSAGNKQTAEVGGNEWKSLASLPDPIGFGGMFGGVLHGRFVVGGGSQFPNKPLWMNGEKAYSDRIFCLSGVTETWKEHATKLPRKMGHFGCATTSDAIYLVGGIDSSGCLNQVMEIRAKGNDFVFKPMTELPHPLGYATAAIAEGKLYVVGGLTAPTNKVASAEVWSLDLANAHSRWQQEPDLPGTGIFVTAMAADGKQVFVFGGIGFNAEGKPTPSREAYCLDIESKKWNRLADLPGARVGATTPCPRISNDKIFVVGGYAEVFPGAMRDHPGFSAQTLFYDLKKRQWESGPILPHAPVKDRDATGDAGPAPMIGAAGVLWQNHVVVAGGEVRSSVRTPAVVAWSLDHLKAKSPQ